ncbi:MAG TPA: peptidyl-alpha-hydroxyglycine alpha-amidating lyase family protein [Bryobacteraceae bacterium]|nr:peptidyl-alpha-hydroxyglycine alpha-amidating lyase family protein [Bryobacteraceae bacterium]
MRSSHSWLAAVALAFGGSLGAQVPEINFDSAPNLLKLPERIYMGEAAGVATNSKGHIFVYTRTGDPYATTGTSRTFTHGGARLLEFDQTGKYVREIGQGLYGFLFAQSVRIDPQDNIWVVDRGSSQVIKFEPDGRVAMVMGRKPESIFVGGRGGGGRGGPEAGGRGAAPGGRGGGGREGGTAPAPGAGSPGDLFNQPSDVAWDAAGDIFVADGYGNSRIAKFDKNGRFLKTWGSRGTQSGQFDTLTSLATDSQGNVYAADRGNKRIQVFDNNGEFKSQVSDVGSPWAICISPGSHQYLYSSDSNPTNSLDNGEIYKLDLDGKVLGKFGRAGKLMKEFGTVNEIDCRRPNELYVGELLNWRVQKLTLR